MSNWVTKENSGSRQAMTGFARYISKEDCYDPTARRRILRSNAVPSVFAHTNIVRSPSERQMRYEHSYAQVPVIHQEPSTSGAASQVKAYQVELHNIKRREKRLRLTVGSLRQRLRQEVKLKDSLLLRLEMFKGKSKLMHTIFDIQGREGIHARQYVSVNNRSHIPLLTATYTV